MMVFRNLILVVLALFGCSPTLSTDEIGKSEHGLVQSYSFVVIASTEIGPTYNDCSGRIQYLHYYLNYLDPDFVVVAGDLSMNGADIYTYYNWDSCIGRYTHRPVFPVPGWNDLSCGAGHDNYLWYHNFQLMSRNPYNYVHGNDYLADFNPQLPTAEEIAADMPTAPSGFSIGAYYTFQYANSKFLMMETGDLSEINTPTAWFDRELAAAESDPDVDFIFVVGRHPIFSIYCEDGCLAPVRDVYYPAMQNSKVAGMFAGKDHVYSRYYAPYNGSAGRYAKDLIKYGRGMYVADVGPSTAQAPTSWPPEWTGQASYWNHKESHLGLTLVEVKVTSPGKMVFKTHDVQTGSITEVDKFVFRRLP